MTASSTSTSTSEKSISGLSVQQAQLRLKQTNLRIDRSNASLREIRASRNADIEYRTRLRAFIRSQSRTASQPANGAARTGNRVSKATVTGRGSNSNAN